MWHRIVNHIWRKLGRAWRWLSGRMLSIPSILIRSPREVVHDGDLVAGILDVNGDVRLAFQDEFAWSGPIGVRIKVEAGDVELITTELTAKMEVGWEGRDRRVTHEGKISGRWVWSSVLRRSSEKGRQEVLFYEFELVKGRRGAASVLMWRKV